jgi:glycosyltransferase involved in cell wall biosynthesis
MSVSFTETRTRYIIVSPVKDEERFVEFTLRSVTSQSLKPIGWLIVNDGSEDRTAEIVNRYAASHPFIRMVSNPRTGIRQTGSAVMRAFNFGLEFIRGKPYDFIVKLDCDLSFEPDYFEKLLQRCSGDPRLGIASGIYLEQERSGAWRPVPMPAYHAAGACKVIRRRCFEEIGGFIVGAGWDTVDEIRATTRGWKTLHFPDLKMKHHKPEGSGIGAIQTGIMHGEIYYLTGGSKLFFLLKVIHRLGTKPYVAGALALLRGYLKAMWKRKIPLVTEAEARCYKSLLLGRLRGQAKCLLARR